MKIFEIDSEKILKTEGVISAIDTVSAVLSINQELVGEEVISREYGFNLLYDQLSRIPYCDIRLCDVINQRASIRISFSRYFKLTNAYLVHSFDECEQVQQGFIASLLSFNENEDINIQLMTWFCNNVTIMLTRVDIPFTYYIGTDETFNGYKNMYKVISKAYTIKNKRAIPKGISVYQTEELETLRLTNTANQGAYNRKIEIYNQARKFENYYGEKEQVYQQILQENPDLSRRMRIEVSRRGLNKKFTLTEFADFNILSEYLIEFTKYAIDNLFDINTINQVYREQIEVLKGFLINERQYPYFNYKNFISSHLDDIWDYEMMRIAIMETTPNHNSAYSATSNIKWILQNIEKEKGIMFMNIAVIINNIVGDFYSIINNK